MPELPEVETIKRALEPDLLEHSFTEVGLLWAKSVKKPSEEEFCRLIIGSSVKAIDRRGKYLIFRLSNGLKLIIHLRMTGTLLLRKPDAEPDKYARVIFYLDDGNQLRFCDVRKLGTIYLVEDETSIIHDMGPEPMEPEFSPQILKRQIIKRTAPIKAVLCDQKAIAGIGNMYADEILHLTKIHPLKKTCELNNLQIKQIYKAIQSVLAEAIRNQGATVSNYATPSGQAGTAQDNFKVAHRFKKPCPTCGTEIARIRVGGRGTYFCPTCQPAD
ncbi:MAG: bifunctional DNA-formamidopyrimidine glycosylase/DNA-(apurinic or apyrimidinic site) lyase [Chloroflexi bacterium]|jgi:formamidopyrimidine-DNA glycosylase|nr:bifunctional DNA-formamidopyrimidine glycosylase/DNA-(apurinic or apyrimidinic site) lyase [Chloroflexota bacterium]MBT7081398.1 bifunctional DNA-formamidopyrimidine glycosylase/DNA-(apurinic or apyrimidinic site) lyase [Chloroflexota bacterium]MBT7290428.1 bifunctional DNA-formamidopyrimidine glycosylase/DNA-(apurinic or apyrimidinic site) lyase [Chloroflexota bacterium]